VSESLEPTWPLSDLKVSPPVGIREHDVWRDRVLAAVTALTKDEQDTNVEAIEQWLQDNGGRVYPSVRWHLVRLADLCEIESPRGRIRLRGEQ
jgi:hypothetical protein